MSELRNPLKPLNGAMASRLKPPTKIASVDIPTAMVEEGQENPTSSIGKRKAEAELRQKLEQRKMMNQTLTASDLKSSLAKPKIDLNATISGASKIRKTTTSSSSLNRTVTLSKPTVAASRSTSTLRSTTTRPTVAAAKSELAQKVDAQESLIQQMLAKMEAQELKMASLEVDKSEKEGKLADIEKTRGALQEDISYREHEIANLTKDKYELQKQLVDLQTESNNQMQSMLTKYQILERTHQGTVGQLSMSKAENDSLKITIEGQTSQIVSLNCEITTLKSTIKTLQDTCADKQKQIEGLLINLDDRNNKIAELEAQIREDDIVRKKLHNTIQELKGNIRVFCRIRPYLGSEIESFGNNPDHFEFGPNGDKSLDINVESKKFSFTFDKVFKPATGQAAVFDEISQLVQSALDGYNTCIFAYGQTGSGKTYTMEGAGIRNELDFPLVDKESRGMIPRAVEQIFATAESLKEKGWQYEMEAMYIEIYNETIRDLLCKKQQDDAKYEIKHDSRGQTTVTNVTTVKVRSPAQVYELLSRAMHNRSVGQTNMNERSSRSHSVFQLKLAGVNQITTETVSGLLNLIDLAGSERLNQSGVTGQRMKETVHINKSLSHLGDVIAALASKDSHIPYRNSKLTYLLQNSLGGNSKTLMFVNISPRISDVNETISSLRFATKVNACEIGTAKKQTKLDKQS